MKTKYLAHLALAGLLVFATGAIGAENQKGNPGQTRSGGSPHAAGGHANTGGGAKFHAQSQGGGKINRGNTARVQNQSRVTVHRQNTNRNVTINRSATPGRAVVNKQQNFHKQQVGQNKINPGVQKQANGRPGVQVSQAERTHIQNVFRQHRGNFHQVARVGFPIFVGASVPRDYAFYDVPQDFVEYAPEYNGYKYIVVGDQILIIDPQTWEIVAVIPV
jgi:hypothetical protein